MRVTIWLLINLSPILKFVLGECNNPNLIFDEGYNIAEPPVKGTEKIWDGIGKVSFIIITQLYWSFQTKMLKWKSNWKYWILLQLTTNWANWLSLFYWNWHGMNPGSKPWNQCCLWIVNSLKNVYGPQESFLAIKFPQLDRT